MIYYKYQLEKKKRNSKKVLDVRSNLGYNVFIKSEEWLLARSPNEVVHMKVQEFTDLVNGLDIEEFSDIPEDKVKYIGSRFDEQWDIEETHSTAMNVYECDDGFVGCRGLCRWNEFFDFSNTPHIKARRVKIELKPTFVEIDDSDTDNC